MLVNKREVAGLLLLLAAVVAMAALDALTWSWPLNILVPTAAYVPGGLLLLPELEKRINRRRGRPVA